MKIGDRVRMSEDYLARSAPGSSLTRRIRGTVVRMHSRYLCLVRFDGEARPTSISTCLLEVERHG
jgi:small-conductance mechanosensitive channel